MLLCWEGPCLRLNADIIQSTYSCWGGATIRAARTPLSGGNEQPEAIIPPPVPLQTPGLVVTLREMASSWGLKMKLLSEELSNSVLTEENGSSSSVVPGAAHPLAHLPTCLFTLRAPGD